MGGNALPREGKSTCAGTPSRATLCSVPNQRGHTGVSRSLRDLRDDGIDQTLQNLLKALTLNLELRARYRVFEFEAAQDGRPEVAALFHRLRIVEGRQIAELVEGLQGRIGALDLALLSDGLA